MIWWQSLLIALAGALIGAATSFAVTRTNLRASQARDETDLQRRRLERSMQVAAELQDKLLNFISACEDVSLDGDRFSAERAAWSRAVRNALPELEPDQPDSTLRGLLNRSHEEVLKAEQYWKNYSDKAGKARLAEALDVCQYVVKSLSDYRGQRKPIRAYSSRSVTEGARSRLYWQLSAGGGSSVRREDDQAGNPNIPPT